MRSTASIVLALLAFAAGPARAQVINGQSTDDAAYAPRPPARWHAPEASGAVPGELPGDHPEDEREPRSGPRHGD